MPPVLSSGSQPALDELRQALRESLGPRRYQNWFGGGTRLELEDAELKILVQNPYLANWIQQQFERDLLQIAARIVGPDVTVRYEIGTDVVLSPVPPELARHAAPQISLSRKTSQVSDPPAHRTRHGNGRRSYTFSDFVVGEANDLAVTAAQQFVVDPHGISPLYLHGGIGNGKTHLLEALRSRFRKEHPELQVMLLTAEHFCNYFTQALDARTLPSFRAKFRSVDVLLVDDVDFLDGRKGFQEEFLHTCKQFENEGRHLVVTANRHPRLLSKTSEELVSRFLSGLVCRIEAPDQAMRREIATRYAARQKRAKLSPEALEHVAQRFTANVREIEGAVNLLATYSTMGGTRVTESIARRLLGRLERDCLRMIRIPDVESAVCEFFGLESEALRSASRKQSLSQPRMLAMYLARKLTQTAYSEIGEHFGGRNHSTVMSAERKIARELNSSKTVRVASEDWTVQDILQAVEERIKAG